MDIWILFDVTFVQKFKELLSSKYFYLSFTLLCFYNLILYYVFHECAETYF